MKCRDRSWVGVFGGAAMAVLALALALSVSLVFSPRPVSTGGGQTLVGERSASSALGPTLNLSVGAAPTAVCPVGLTNCSASVGITRVTLEADAPLAPTLYWPDVQVAFVLETTPYDGVYYHDFTEPGNDPCALAGTGKGPLCEESNSVPFFMAHAGEVAQTIENANPHSAVSFALVDYSATDYGDFNDGLRDGTKYHVDVSRFTSATNFGPAVTQTFTNGEFGGHPYGSYGMDDNFLHSSSITALYGTVIGSGLDWSPGAHHVIVLLTSTAPQDPNYPENYCVSAFDPQGEAQHFRGPGCFGSTCSPPYQFPVGYMPACEGWTTSQDGVASHSIAALTHSAPTCTDSIGGACTVDVVDLYATSTDPYSPGWPDGFSSIGGGSGGPVVLENTQNVIFAGCALAAATGGSWDGPAGSICPDSRYGDLGYVDHGPVLDPNTGNPTLLAALGRVAFGPVSNPVVAEGVGRPLFTFVPTPAFAVAPNPEWQVACETPEDFRPDCQLQPTVGESSGVRWYGFNWSVFPSENSLRIGDRWTASVNLIATGALIGPRPVDACLTAGCLAAGSGSLGGLFTQALYALPTNGTVVSQSFPVAIVDVQSLAAPAAGTPPPPPPVALPLPTLPIPAIPPTPAVPPPPAPAVLSVQAAAAGVMGAGFLRIGLRRKIGVPVASLSNPVRGRVSRFETGPHLRARPPVGKFE